MQELVEVNLQALLFVQAFPVNPEQFTQFVE